MTIPRDYGPVRFKRSARRAEPGGPRYAAALVIIVLAAVLLRVWFWWFQAQSGAVQPADPEEYYRAALHILQGGYHDDGKWLRPPLYPLFLALMFAIGGIDVAFALLGQAVLTGVGVLLFVTFTARLFGRRAGLWGGAIAALFVPLASFGSVLFAEALFVLLIMAALLLLDLALFEDRGAARPAPRPAVLLAAGLVLGLAALTRAVALYFLPLAALLIWWIGRRAGGRRSLSAQFVPPLLLALGTALVIGPWAARNYAVHERLILVDTNGGISMWYGMVQGEEDRRRGEALIFGEPNLADRQALALQLTRERILEDPGLFLLRMRYKIASLLLLQTRSYATGEVVTISPQDEQIALSAGENPLWLTLIADAQYVAIMLLGIAGIGLVTDWRRALPALAWLAFGVLITAATVAHHRLRLPLVAVMIPFAAYALVVLPQVLRATDTLGLRRALPIAAGWFLFLALIFSWNYLTWLGGLRHAVAGYQAQARGDLFAAQTAFEQARSADPRNALRVLDLADLAWQQRQYEQALRLYAEAAALEPRNLYARAMRMQIAGVAGIPSIAAIEQDAIAGYGRDNNDLYDWAWDAAATSPPDRVIPGDPLALGHYNGFAPATFDLASGRWTLGTARLRLSGGCNAVSLRLQGPAGREVQLAVAGQPATAATVTLDGSPQTVRLPLDGAVCTPGEPLVLRITSERNLLDLDRAPWNVGVAIEEVWVQ